VEDPAGEAEADDAGADGTVIVHRSSVGLAQAVGASMAPPNRRLRAA
jgi:hypothetical protein